MAAVVKRMSNAGKTCSTDDCNGDAYCCGLCTACYSWHHNRATEGVAQGQRYRKKMKRIQNRIEALPTPSPKRGVTASRSRSRGEARAYH